VYVVGALAAAFAQDVTWLIAARFVLGLAVGTASFVAPEYIAEQTPPKIRGGTVTYNQVMVTLGILIAYIVGFLLNGATDNWRWMLGIAVVAGAALAISMVFVPHSPRWLAKQGRIDEAREVLERTRSDSDIDAELENIQDVSEKEQGWKVTDLFGSKARALMVVGTGLAVFQQFVGVNTVIFFLQETKAIGRGPTAWIYAAVGIVAIAFFRSRSPRRRTGPWRTSSARSVARS
jgi:MFS family permease